MNSGRFPSSSELFMLLVVLVLIRSVWKFLFLAQEENKQRVATNLLSNEQIVSVEMGLYWNSLADWPGARAMAFFYFSFDFLSKVLYHRGRKALPGASGWVRAPAPSCFRRLSFSAGQASHLGPSQLPLLIRFTLPAGPHLSVDLFSWELRDVTNLFSSLLPSLPELQNCNNYVLPSPTRCRLLYPGSCVIFFFKWTPCPVRGWNSPPWDQERHALPTEPDRCPSSYNFVSTCVAGEKASSSPLHTRGRPASGRIRDLASRGWEEAESGFTPRFMWPALPHALPHVHRARGAFRNLLVQWFSALDTQVVWGI